VGQKGDNVHCIYWPISFCKVEIEDAQKERENNLKRKMIGPANQNQKTSVEVGVNTTFVSFSASS
jgi:hypothetical protein